MSLLAVHEKVAVVAVVFVACRFEGDEGGVVSNAALNVAVNDCGELGTNIVCCCVPPSDHEANVYVLVETV